jgi:hypothetical protein
MEIDIMGLNIGYLKAKTDKESDECFTPSYAVTPLLKYLKQGTTIWCPFDKEYSNYVKEFQKAGYKVIASHIDSGENFFYYEPEEPYDVIISNPPFSIKDEILKRLDELGKPYAMLFPLPTLQGQKRFQYLVGSQALIFNKRVNFYKDIEMKEMQKGVSFASIYICKDFLPRDLIFEELVGA